MPRHQNREIFSRRERVIGFRGVAAAVLIEFAAVAASCADEPDSITALSRQERDPVQLTVILRDQLPTFKVDGRLQIDYQFAPLLSDGDALGEFVLPSGARQATFIVALPRAAGQLVIVERTFSPFAPFLCGRLGMTFPRPADEVTVFLDMCQP